ncbi:MAG: hypothetical protein EOM20_11105 [Spartobacteria bacterium]|nr:hypothetical protein [Spartobacteria bacterium]
MGLRHVRHTFEYLLTKLALRCIPALPRRGVIRTSRLLGSMAFHLARHLRRVGLVNLDLALGDTVSPAQKRRILETSFQTFALTLLDVFWFSRKSAERMKRYVHFDESHDVFFQKTPTICLTAHMGNWELLGRATAMAGFPMTSVAAPLANKALDDLFNSMRSNTGQTVVSKKGAIRKLLKVLQEGGKVAFLLDQNTKPADGGEFVDFFGLPVPISTAVSSIVLHTGLPILFACCIPSGAGDYRITPIRSINPSAFQSMEKEEAVHALTQHIATIMEEEIRATPGAWLWVYKRWKYVAPGRNRDEYPFYAKCLG